MSLPNEKHVDVLIVGAGPAGLVAATWMARCGVKTLLVDKRSADMRSGHGDGIQARTLEILDSFGLADAVWKESYHMGEMCLWNPGPDGWIQRSSRMPNTIPGLSRFRQGVILSQHRVEEILLASLSAYPEVEIQREVVPDDLIYSPSGAESGNAYPITVSLRRVDCEQPAKHVSSRTPSRSPSTPFTDFENPEHGHRNCPSVASVTTNGHGKAKAQDQVALPEQKQAESMRSEKWTNGGCHEGNIQTVKAKYVIGCDGAHSWTRSQLGIKMTGEHTDFVWGVIDIIPITDFPDIRSRCAIHSAKSGSIMVIPREGGRLIRIYCQLNEVSKGQGGKFDRSEITEETIFKTAQKIIKPYTLEYKYCENWTVYQIGQRVGEQFSVDNRIFLAGDAIHTHSPKAGQGMNVSMQDTFNLGWKLALVVKGFARRSLLSTYEQERRGIALELIAFDQRFSKLFSSRPAKDATDNAGISMDVFKDAFIKQKLFSSGFAVDYGPSVLVAKPGGETAQSCHHPKPLERPSQQSLALNIPLGKRFPNAKVINHSDARPWEFATWLKADGRFRIILLAGNVSDLDQMQRMHSFCTALQRPGAMLQRPMPRGWTLGSLVEILTIHSAPREAVELADFPELLHPFHAALGWDYDKIFVDGESYYEAHGEAYQRLGVDKQRGCVVVTRPDQHVGWIGELKDTSQLGAYFEGFLATNSKAD